MLSGAPSSYCVSTLVVRDLRIDPHNNRHCSSSPGERRWPQTGTGTEPSLGAAAMSSSQRRRRRRGEEAAVLLPSPLPPTRRLHPRLPLHQQHQHQQPCH